MVQTVRVPEIIDLSGQRIAVGDTTAFVTKINTTQQKLEGFSADLTDMVSDLAIVTEDIENQSSAAVEAANSTASDLQTVQNLMDVSLSPAIDAAVEYISDVFSSEGSSKILNPELKLLASSDISKAAPVVLNDDGTVSPVGIDTGTVGPLQKITPNDPIWYANVFNVRYSTYLIVYYDYAVTQFAMIGVSGNATYVIDSGVLFGGNADVYMWEDQSGNIDVLFGNYSPDYAKYYTKIIVTPTTATVQPLQNLGVLDGFRGVFERTDNGKFIFLARENTPLLTASVISVSGAVANIDYSELGLRALSGAVDFCKLDPLTGKVVFGYTHDSVNYINTITPDYISSFNLGAELSVQGVLNVANPNYNDNHLYFSDQVGKLLLCDIYNGHAKVRGLDTTGAQISLGLVSEFGGGSYDREPYVFFDPIRNKHAFFWREAYGTGLNYCFADYENGSFNFGTPVVYDSTNRSRVVVAYDISASSAVVFDTNNSNPRYGYSRIVAPAGTNARDLLGVAKEGVLAGAAGGVYVKGDVADGFTDLVINSDYWVNEIGELSLLDTGLPKLGRAVSSTKMLIEGRN